MSSATMARSHGIEVVYQDLALADQQTVYMNMFLGRELTNGIGLLDRKTMISETEKLVEELDVRIPSPFATIRDLSGGQRQGVAIARATRWAKQADPARRADSGAWRRRNGEGRGRSYSR
jgi:ABC-type sugar transport system ATPase subunit